MQFLPSEIIEYHRKSRQDDPNQAIEEVLAKHKRIADEWVAENLPGRIPDRNIYMERVSGETIRDREEFKKVLRRIESPDIKAVFAIEVQRLGRGDLEDCGHIINVFRLTNTKVITPRRIYDLTDDGDRMIFEMEMKSGNQYLEYTRRLMQRGKLDAAKRGCWVTSEPPIGYDITFIGKNRTLKPNKDAALVKRIFESYAAGEGLYNIARQLNQEGYRTRKGKPFMTYSIARIIRNKTYIGKVCWGISPVKETIQDGERIKKRIKKEPDVFDGLHEPIISQEIFDRVQEIIGNKPHTPVKSELRNPVATILKCGKCGKTMTFAANGRNKRVYRCKMPTCETGSISKEELLEEVAEAIRGEIENREIRVEAGENRQAEIWNERIQAIRARLCKLDEMELKQWEDRYNSDHSMPDSVFRKLTEKLNSERKTLQEALEELESNKPDEDTAKEKIEMLHHALACFDGTYSVEDKNRMLKEVFEEILYFRNKKDRNAKENPYRLEFYFKI